MGKKKLFNVIVPLLVTIALCFVAELAARNANLDNSDIHYLKKTFAKISKNNDSISSELAKLQNVDDGLSKVVILGGSSVEKIRNYPLAFEENFDPDVTIVNLGVSAFTSSGVVENFKKAIQYHPDLFIVYSGHNNYWSETEGLTSEVEYLSGISQLLLRHSNVFRYLIVKRLRSQLGESVRTTKNPMYEKLHAVHLNNDLIKFSKTFRYGMNDPNVAVVTREELAPIMAHEKKAIDRFRADMQYIVSECKKKGVPLIIVTPVSSPNTYDYYLSYINAPKSLKDFSEKFSEADKSFHAGDLKTAFNILSHMEEEYPENGLVASFLATYYDIEKNYKKANEFDLKAIELNLRSHRAKRALEDVIRGLDDQKKHIYVLDIERIIFSDKNTARVTNMELFIDYLHPSLKLYYFLGFELNNLIRDKKLIYPKHRKV